MLLFGLLSSPIEFLIFIAVILSALTVHEFAHAWTADKLGDPTSKALGRLTFNPLAHLDPLGTLFLLIAGFGWGKPVLVDSRHFANPKLDNLTVSLAGPMSNFLTAAILGLLLRFLVLPAFAQEILILAVFFNLTLMIFNLLPIPPLDGSKVLNLFLSEETGAVLQQFGFYILLFLLIFADSIPVIPFIIQKVVGFFFILLTGQGSPL